MLTVDIVNAFLTLWLKPMCLLALAISIVKHSFNFSAASSHWFLSSSFFITALAVVSSVVLGHLAFPPILVPIVPQSLAPLMTLAPFTSAVTLVTSYCLLGIYFMGLCWVLSFQCFGLLEIQDISKRAISCRDPRVQQALNKIGLAFSLDTSKIEVKISTDLESPLMWGYFSACILLPVSSAQWPSERLERVLAHELAHVNRNDWLIKVSGKFFTAVFWPLPLSWMVLRKIEWFSELACDDKVIKHFDCRAEYAEDLIMVSRQREKTGWAMSFNRESQIYNRIRYILDGRNHRDEPPPASKYLNFFMCCFLTVPLFIFQVAPQAQAASVVESGSDISLAEDSAEARPFNSLVDEAPSWPYKKSQFIQILPDSPKFLEEMTVSITRDVNENSFSSELVSLPDVSKAPIVGGKLKEPRLEVKGFLPRLMHTPPYPRSALRKGIEGKVIVQFDIDEAGYVIRPRVVYAQPKNVFEKAVLKALKKSRFSPMEIQGRAIITKNISETFSFRLDSPSD